MPKPAPCHSAQRKSDKEQRIVISDNFRSKQDEFEEVQESKLPCSFGRGSSGRTFPSHVPKDRAARRINIRRLELYPLSNFFEGPIVLRTQRENAKEPGL